MSRLFGLLASVLLTCFLVSCDESSCPEGSVAGVAGQCVIDDSFGRCADFDPLRQVYWGDTHVHTDLSFDANMQGTRTTQDDAYAFARGETIELQPYTEDGTATRSATIDRPLDFVALSDHAEFLGVLKVCNDPSSPSYESRQCVDYRNAQEFDADPQEVTFIFVEINGATAFPPDQAGYPDLCGPDGVLCIDAGMEVWRDIVVRADGAYDTSDSCELTTFPGYEWSGGPAARNLHRNVIFKNGSVTELPYSYLDEPYAEGLWARLEDECTNTDSLCDVLTIPHNSNLSDGIYFEDRMANGEPFTEDYVEQRNRLEPVIEIYQHKGASECLPGETTSDELCGFEILPFTNLATTDQSVISDPNPAGFLRYAYGEGMRHEATLGTNPFEYGITAATDTHISAPGFVAEDDFKGHGGAGQPNRFLPPPQGFPDSEYLSSGGLTAVWAEENAREAIFSAFRRKETFGTSGPRMVVRMFGGWEYPTDLCDADDLAQQGYDGGVPMGGRLGARVGLGGPRFVVSARQDAQGAPLQRIQIVKGSLVGDAYEVEVFDVAGGPNGASVDLDTCSPQGAGASDLCAVWEDSSFDPAARSYYYARVIENPTCRWSTRQCVGADVDCSEWDFERCQDLEGTGARDYTCDCCDPSAGLNVELCDEIEPSCDNAEELPADEARCCVPRVEPTVQERAWTSPIWYQPPG